MCCELVKDILSSDMYTLHFDEATHSADGSKQLDLHVRYWSTKYDEVVVSFLKGIPLGHAYGKTMADAMTETIQQQGIQLSKMLTLGNDGPNVNKTVFTILNERVLNVRDGPLLDISSCVLHTIHNAFEAGTKAYGNLVVELSIDLHLFFKISSARQEDLKQVQEALNVCQHVFLRYSPTRWLTLVVVLIRIREQWSVIIKIWNNLKNSDEQPVSGPYKRIASKLQTKEAQQVLYVQLEFLICVAKLFESVLTYLQKPEPLIHVLHDKMKELLQSLDSRFLRPDCIKNDIWLVSTDTKNQMKDAELVIGEDTRKAMIKMSHEERKKQILGKELSKLL